jgi:hypothetical protein
MIQHARYEHKSTVALLFLNIILCSLIAKLFYELNSVIAAMLRNVIQHTNLHRVTLQNKVNLP